MALADQLLLLLCCCRRHAVGYDRFQERHQNIAPGDRSMTFYVQLCADTAAAVARTAYTEIESKQREHATDEPILFKNRATFSEISPSIVPAHHGIGSSRQHSRA